MEKFIQIEGTPLRISQQGDSQKPAIVMLHGFLESLEVFDDLADVLADSFCILRCDLPGHGFSGSSVTEVNTMEFMAKAVKAMTDEYKIDKVHLLGHSLGGYVSLAFAEQYPEHYSSLIFAHSTPNPDTEQKKEDRLQQIRIIKEGKTESLLNLFIPQLFASHHRKKFEEQILKLQVHTEFLEPEGIIATLKGMMERKDYKPFLSQCNQPYTFIFGKEDNFIPYNTVAQELIRQFPKAVIYTLEHSGHIGFIEEQDQFVECLCSFLQ